MLKCAFTITILSYTHVQASTPNHNLVLVTMLETLQFRKRPFQEKCLEHVSANMILEKLLIRAIGRHLREN